MIWKSKTLQSLAIIARTGFLVSLVAYLAFWVMDLMIPGFVSRYFSVHMFLLTALVFGILWARELKEYEERTWIHQSVAVLFGLLTCVIVWKSGESLGGYRLLISAIALLSPSLILQLIRD